MWRQGRPRALRAAPHPAFLSAPTHPTLREGPVRGHYTRNGKMKRGKSWAPPRGRAGRSSAVLAAAVGGVGCLGERGERVIRTRSLLSSSSLLLTCGARVQLGARGLFPWGVLVPAKERKLRKRGHSWSLTPVVLPLSHARRRMDYFKSLGFCFCSYKNIHVCVCVCVCMCVYIHSSFSHSMAVKLQCLAVSKHSVTIHA